MTAHPVRCCCQPNKIFGYLDLPTEGRPGYYTVFEHLKPLKVGPICNPVLTIEAPQNYTVELRPIIADGELNVAVYSDDRPIEFWRSIRGFRECYGPHQP